MLRTALLLALFSPALAQGPDSSKLPADTRGVFHLSVADGPIADLLDAVLGDLDRELAPANADQEPGRSWPRALVRGIVESHGIDLRRDLLAVTVFSADPRIGHPTLMLTVTPRFDAVVDDLRTAGVLRRQDHDGVSLDRLDVAGLAGWWLPSEEAGEPSGIELDTSFGDAMWFGVVRPAEAAAPRRLVIGRASEVARIHRVAAGEEPSLGADESAVLHCRARAGTFLYVEAAQEAPAAAGGDPLTGAIESVRRLRIELGRVDRDLVLELAAGTRSREDARRVTALVQGGMSAIGVLGNGADVPAAVTELVRRMRIVQDGENVSVELRIDEEELLEDLRERIGRRRGR